MRSVLLGFLIGLVGFQEVVQLSQEGIAVDAVDLAGFLNGLTPGRGAAQAMHANGEEQGSGLRRYIQNITDNRGFFNFNSYNMTSCNNSPPIITAVR